MCDVITRVYGRFVCHVISITYQTIEEGVLQELLGLVDENSIKVKLLTNSTFDAVEPVLSWPQCCRSEQCESLIKFFLFYFM